MTFNGEIQDIVREKDTNQPEKGEDDGGGKSTNYLSKPLKEEGSMN